MALGNIIAVVISIHAARKTAGLTSVPAPGTYSAACAVTVGVVIHRYSSRDSGTNIAIAMSDGRMLRATRRKPMSNAAKSLSSSS